MEAILKFNMYERELEQPEKIMQGHAKVQEILCEQNRNLIHNSLVNILAVVV